MNLVQCRTTKIGLRGIRINRDPTAKEIRACATRFLWPELAGTVAKVIDPLGQLAYEWLTFYRAVRKGETPIHNPKLLPPSLKTPGGLAGPFSKGMGHRIRIRRDLYIQAAAVSMEQLERETARKKKAESRLRKHK